MTRRKSETTGSIRVSLPEDYNMQYLCQSLLFFVLQEKLILVYTIRFSLTLSLRHKSLLSCFIAWKGIVLAEQDI